MTIQQAINPTQVAREVVIVGPGGEKTSVFVQPNSKVKLAEGFKVCPDFRSRNPSIQTRELK